jgi:uncharacterized protein YdhG (YjbR/CyaY superfamily)
MKGRSLIPANVDQYISYFPASTQKLLKDLRATVKKAAPDAEEIISYQMPAYRYHGILLNFAAYNTHIGLYPTPGAIEAFKSELSKWPLSKGTVQFPLDKPLPLSLITKIVKYRVRENRDRDSLRPKKKK